MKLIISIVQYVSKPVSTFALIMCPLFSLHRSDSSFSFFFFFFVFFFQVAVYIIQTVGIPHWGNRSVGFIFFFFFPTLPERVVEVHQDSVFHCMNVHAALGYIQCAWTTTFLHSHVFVCEFFSCLSSIAFLWQIPAALINLGCCFVSVCNFYFGSSFLSCIKLLRFPCVIFTNFMLYIWYLVVCVFLFNPQKKEFQCTIIITEKMWNYTFFPLACFWFWQWMDNINHHHQDEPGCGCGYDGSGWIFHCKLCAGCHPAENGTQK